MMADGRSAAPRDTSFPALQVTVLALCMAQQSYTYINLFPYVGMMVKELFGLESPNESGEHVRAVHTAAYPTFFHSVDPLCEG